MKLPRRQFLHLAAGAAALPVMRKLFLAVAFATTIFVTANQHPLAAQTLPTSAGPVSADVIEDLVAASRILADQGVLDAFGHVSIRHPSNPNRYLMSRSQAPALMTADDVIEYDLDSNPITANGRPSFGERFIHGAVYKARPDVNSVVHSHSPAVIPFGVSQVPLRALFTNAGFLASGVPVFEIRKYGGMTNLLVHNLDLGNALAETLGDKPVALMRGHGNVVVGRNVQVAVYRAIYTEINARLQLQAIGLGGAITYLEKEEGEKIDSLNNDPNHPSGATGGILRPWGLWKKKVMGK
jgi:ribulose-5-phosphate 4-epimerase/fuculose-1-phosphate aldolase